MIFSRGGGGRGIGQYTPVWQDMVCKQCGKVGRFPTHPLHPLFKSKCDCGGEFKKKGGE